MYMAALSFRLACWSQRYRTMRCLGQWEAFWNSETCRACAL